MRRRALITGIARYSRPDWRDLWGVEADVAAWQDVLMSQVGIRPEDTRALVNERCTRPAFAERLDWLFGGLGAADVAYLVYCGHGARYPARNADGVVSAVHESLVLYDFSWDSPLSDVELGEMVRVRNTGGCQLRGVFDCCHSGGLSRDGERRLPGQPPGVDHDYAREVPLPRDIAVRDSIAAATGVQYRGLGSELGQLGAFLFACSAEEKAWESWINGQFRGLFSFAAERAIRGGKRSFADILTDARATIEDRGFSGGRRQTPATNDANALLA